MSEEQLSMTAVTAGYGAGDVLRDIDLTVARGEVVVLLGANGAGKTTMLRVLSGALRPRFGDVRFAAHDVLRLSPHALARAGLVHVPENRGIFQGLTVEEHFRLGRRRTRDGLKLASEYFPALAELRRRRAGLLSGGEQQMLALARALAIRPQALLLDELSLGLAPIIVQRLLPIVRSYATAEGTAVLLVEQHIRLALAIADRGYVLARGEVALAGSASELLADRHILVGSYLGEAGSHTQGHSEERKETVAK